MAVSEILNDAAAISARDIPQKIFAPEG